MNGRILIVDDDQDMCRLLETDLVRRGFAVTWFTAAEAALAELDKNPADVLLTDLRLGPGMDGLALCEKAVARQPDLPVIVITAFGNMQSAIAAIRAGAYDFVTKPVDMDFLSIALERAVGHHALKEKVSRLSQAVRQQARSFGDLLGDSGAMHALYDTLERIAPTDTSVLITGETGTGKELVAKALHAKSRRRGPFVAVNCAAVPESLMESELFGHARGAFTGARDTHNGFFRQADGGTLFFDEVAELPVSLQAKLLRAIEEHTVRPVGAEAEVPFDARIIAATNIDLEKAVEQDRFRRDLYFRINVIQVELPPLRRRGNDILLLARHFLTHFAARFDKAVSGIAKPAGEKLLAYTWPGNVRELKHCIERAVALARGHEIGVEDLPPKIARSSVPPPDAAGFTAAGLVPLSEMERAYILHVLDAVDGNRTMAAGILGLDRKTLYRKLQRYIPSTDR